MRPACAQVLKRSWSLGRHFAEVHFHFFFRLVMSSLEQSDLHQRGSRILKDLIFRIVDVHFPKSPDGGLTASRTTFCTNEAFVLFSSL